MAKKTDYPERYIKCNPRATAANVNIHHTADERERYARTAQTRHEFHQEENAMGKRILWASIGLCAALLTGLGAYYLINPPAPGPEKIKETRTYDARKQEKMSEFMAQLAPVPGVSCRVNLTSGKKEEPVTKILAAQNLQACFEQVRDAYPHRPESKYGLSFIFTGTSEKQVIAKGSCNRNGGTRKVDCTVTQGGIKHILQALPAANT